MMNKFDDIQHTPLRVYNRVVMMHNILEDGGQAALEAYIAQFEAFERKQMFIMQAFVKMKGVEFVQKVVTKGLETQYEGGDIATV